MTVVIYTYPGETDSHEVFGPFESDAKAEKRAEQDLHSEWW